MESNFGPDPLDKTTPVPPLAPRPKPELKLDLACGHGAKGGGTKPEGYLGVDILPGPGVDFVQDLLRFPWQWETSSVDAIKCEHFLEHIPMLWWGKKPYTFENISGETVSAFENGHKIIQDDPKDKELLFAFMDECWRILKPNAHFNIIVPNGFCDRGFQDPTHRRFFCKASWLYFTKTYRDINIPQYNVECDFYDFHSKPGPESSDLVMALSGDVQGRNAETRAFWGEHYINVIRDWSVCLKAKK